MLKRLISEKIRLSIFLQMLLAFVLSSALVVILVFGFMRWILNPTEDQRVIQDKNRTAYSHFLMNQIGMPPHLDEATRLAGQLGIKIRITGPEVNFSSCPLIPKDEALWKKTQRCEWESSTRIGRIDRRVV